MTGSRPQDTDEPTHQQDAVPVAGVVAVCFGLVAIGLSFMLRAPCEPIPATA